MSTEPDFSLPEPSAADQAKSLQLIDELRTRMAQGPLPFADYMQLVLYHPAYGYYGSGQVAFGAGGDFVTAPERSPLFADGLVYEWQQAVSDGLGTQVLELGAGSGQLILDFLAECDRRDCVPERYWIMEISPALRDRQQARVATELPGHLADRVQWVTDWTELSDPIRGWQGGVVIANEVLDAMPVARFLWQPGVVDSVRELGVCPEGGRFGWCEMPPSAALLAALQDVPFPFDSTVDAASSETAPVAAEINPNLAAWLDDLRGGLQQASTETRLYLFDYGGRRTDVYRPDRVEGTLRCHYRHRAHDDPFVYPGLQDITTWVDFDRLACLAQAAGFVADGARTQAAWLLGTDVPARFAAQMQAATDRAVAARLSQGFKELVLPTEMGERFQVLRLRLA